MTASHASSLSLDATHWSHHPAAAPTGHLHHLLLCLHRRHGLVAALWHVKHLCWYWIPISPRHELPLVKITLLLLLLHLNKKLLLLLMRNRHLHAGKSVLLCRMYSETHLHLLVLTIQMCLILLLLLLSY